MERRRGIGRTAAFLAKTAFCICLAVFFAGCAHTPPPPPGTPGTPPGLRTQKPYQIKGIWYYPLPTADGYVEEGIASWYGSDFHGKRTSCGELYDMYGISAAHKTLPLGTYVKVTHLGNGRSIVLRVNDRGPFVSGRIIDLSCGAAQELGMMNAGTARVRVEAVQVASEQHIGQDTYWKADPVPSFRYGHFNIQIGAFKDQNNAYRLRDKMKNAHRDVMVYAVNDRSSSIYRVQVGTYSDLMAARDELAKLQRSGFGDAFVVAADGN